MIPWNIPQKAVQDADTGVVIANDADAERCFELLPLITRKAGSIRPWLDMASMMPWHGTDDFTAWVLPVWPGMA